MEPMLPSDRSSGRLEDLAIDLIAKANRLAGSLRPNVAIAVGDLVRSMNCYYSNLIEGHNTHPRDIERAMADVYHHDAARRALQLEAKAHIEVQRKIDQKAGPSSPPTSEDFIRWIHRDFCERLPEELLRVTDPETGETRKVVPGQFRDGGVRVGRHFPPPAEFVGPFLTRFSEAYAPSKLSAAQSVIAVAAAHHRFVWIHPFYDGNGRVVRLLSHAMLLNCGVGSTLWSVARGLARKAEEYKDTLARADQARSSDLDGRGALSQQGLDEFCEFFLTVCIDQIEFMESRLQADKLLTRMKLLVDEEVEAGTLPRGSMALLKEALLAGQLERSAAASLTGYKERRGRQTLSRLLERGLLVSQGPRAPVRLGFPVDVVERWFPLLYPSVD